MQGVLLWRGVKIVGEGSEATSGSPQRVHEGGQACKKPELLGIHEGHFQKSMQPLELTLWPEACLLGSFLVMQVEFCSASYSATRKPMGQPTDDPR